MMSQFPFSSNDFSGYDFSCEFSSDFSNDFFGDFLDDLS